MGRTRSDSKVMRLIPEKSFILVIHQLKSCHLQSTFLVPAHTLSSGAAIVCSIPGTQHEECRLRPALQTTECLLLTQNGVLSLPILFFGIKRSRRARDQVSKEAAASPQCLWMSKTALQRTLHGLAHCRDEGSSLWQCLDEPAWLSFWVFQEYLCSNIDWLSVQQEPSFCEQYLWNQRSTQACISILTWTCVLSLALVIPSNAIPNFGVWSLDHIGKTNSSPVITCSIKSGSASTCSSSSAETLTRASRCYCVRFLGTILAQIFLIPNSSVSIQRTASRFTFTSSAILLTVNLRSDRTGSRTHAVLSLVRVVDGRPLRYSSSTMVLPSENILCQRKACVLDIASSPKACGSFSCVVVAPSPSLIQKGWHTAARCSVLPSSWRGSKTRLDTWGTYSPMSDCKAMPLQVGIEEGLRSTAVCVSGLQYCQYSQKKISLITLLLDLVYTFLLA